MSLFTEKGNLKTAVRDNFHAQVANKYLSDYVRMDNGEYVLELITEEGKTIKAVINLSISTKENFSKPVRKGKKTSEQPVVQDLFD